MSISRFAPDSGRVKILHDLETDIGGRDVVVVEDIVDTGLTITALLAGLSRLDPASLDVCALLHKHVDGAKPVDIRYKGFEIPNEFVVGYGMDYAERYRHLPGVYRLTL
jgi:hypoxanthine phosphoribosyltransferase